MLSRALLLAATQIETLPETMRADAPTKIFGLSVRDLLLVVGIVAIIALSLFMWAYLKRRHRQGHVARSSRVIEQPIASTEQSSRYSRRHRRRRKRRSHSDTFPRNPTLGETGGLPPVRPDEPAEPAR